MKSIVTFTFLVTLLLTAGTALAYDCYNPPPPPPPAPCPQYQKMQYRQDAPCPTRCGKCDRYGDRCAVQKKSCEKKVVHQHTYQCQTTCTAKTKETATVQCDLCGTRYPKGVEHYCPLVQCKKCGHVHPRDVEHRCGMVQCRSCGEFYPQGMQHHCGEVRCPSCGVHYYPGAGHNCQARYPQGDSFRRPPCERPGKQCPAPRTQGCNISRQETRQAGRTSQTSWQAWFKNQEQAL